MFQHDVVICGAGLNGLTMALALGGPGNRTPLNVAIIDARSSLHPKTRDTRATAITEAGRRMFEALGIWPDLCAHSQVMREIIVTDGRPGEPRPVLLQFLEHDQPGGPSAWLVENGRLIELLDKAVRSSPSITFMEGINAQQFNFSANMATITAVSGEVIHAKLVVAADGRRSILREAAGIRGIGWTYDQCGIVTTVTHEKSHEGRAEEHFLPPGPFAILPLPGNRSSLVWTEQTENAKRLLSLPDQDFLQELNLRFGGHLGKLETDGHRQSWPLELFLATSFIAPRLALIGDAAHVVHPIAGLGFNLGLRDIAVLAQSVVDRSRIGLDVGDSQTLSQYQRQRFSDTLAVALATDGLNRLFSNDVSGLRQLRDLGLSLVNKVPAAKTFFMREAAGLSLDLPRLMTGNPL